MVADCHRVMTIMMRLSLSITSPPTTNTTLTTHSADTALFHIILHTQLPTPAHTGPHPQIHLHHLPRLIGNDSLPCAATVEIGNVQELVTALQNQVAGTTYKLAAGTYDLSGLSEGSG